MGCDQPITPALPHLYIYKGFVKGYDRGGRAGVMVAAWGKGDYEMLRGRLVDLEAVHTSSISFGRLAWEFPFTRQKCSVRSPTLLNRRSRMSLGNS